MKRIHHITCLLLAAGFISVLPAQVPQLINYQGRVAVGDPPVNFDGTGTFKFALVDAGIDASSQAAATAVLTSGFVTSVTVSDGGSGYLTQPAVSFTGGGGSGAAAHAVVSSGAVTSIVVDNAGSGYASPPAVVIDPPPSSVAHATYWSNDGTSTNGSEPASAILLTVTKGLYSVLLGDATLPNMTVVPAPVFQNSGIYLRVWFDDGVHGSQLLSPDQRIAAVGYAMMAGGLQPGTDISAGSVTASSVTATSFSGDGSGLTNIPAATITGTIPASQVAMPPPGMALIPAGEFTMGNSIGDADITNAVPVSTTVSAFYMDMNEVTLSQWQAVQQWGTLVGGYTDLAAGSGKGADHPVHTVSWYDCVKWCNARSEREGKTPVYYTDNAQTAVYRTLDVDVTNAQVKWSANGYRLPTEAEWEKAARGGLSGQRFPWGNTISQGLANYYGNTALYAYGQGPDGYNAIGAVGGTSPATSPVGSFAANGYGLHDMAGNVSEWCWDLYPSPFTPYAGGTDPHGATTGSNRGLRGGYWGNYADLARCAARIDNGSPVYLDSSIGFRAVLPPGQP